MIWQDASGETGYTVQISTSSTFTNNYVTWTLSANAISSFVTWPATTGNQYYWQVLATNKWGATKASNEPFIFTP